MKITIVQREIEEAIRQYIHNQIVVKEGHEITMDFTSTRGDDGLIAAINIAPMVGNSGGTKSDVTEKPAPVEVQVSAPVVETLKPRVSRSPMASRAVEVRVESTEDETTEVVQEQPVDTQDTNDEESLVEGDQPLKAAPSIFAGLRRPTNEAAEASEA